jgi:hypothetical protein
MSEAKTLDELMEDAGVVRNTKRCARTMDESALQIRYVCLEDCLRLVKEAFFEGHILAAFEDEPDVDADWEHSDAYAALARLGR